MDSKSVGRSIREQFVVEFGTLVTVNEDGHALDSLDDLDDGIEYGCSPFVFDQFNHEKVAEVVDAHEHEVVFGPLFGPLSGSFKDCHVL